MAETGDATRPGISPGASQDPPGAAAEMSAQANGAGRQGSGAGAAFAFFHAITPGLTSAQRAELFARLPIELQQEAWESLGRALEERDT